MAIDEFTNVLYEEMVKKLAELQNKDPDTLQTYRIALALISQSISKLKSFIAENAFADSRDEINFFKNLKPKFFSKLIFYQKVFEIQSRLPLGTTAEIKRYYEKELNKINDYLVINNEFVSYYRSNASFLDHVYFIRQEPESWLLLNFEDYETDLYFTTVYDHKLSKIIAYEQLSTFINNAVARLEVQLPTETSPSANTEQKVTWTGSKASLIELLYALQSSGACNNGVIDLKQLADHFETLFNIDLGNYYRVFQEIRIRKINRTAFLDHLKERLINRMDETDLNPKFK